MDVELYNLSSYNANDFISSVKTSLFKKLIICDLITKSSLFRMLSLR